MLALLVLCDGPISSGSFRPFSDETQWWARRDSLVRIDFAYNYSIKSDKSTKSPASATSVRSFMLFNDLSVGSKGDVDKYGPALVSFSLTSNISSMGYLPSESNFINMLKASSSSVSSLSFKQASGRESFRSALFERPATNIASLRSDISKKELIQKIQSGWSFEFLKQHSMAGSADLIAKKRNLADLHQVWWTLSADRHQSGNVTVNPLISLFERVFIQLKSITTAGERKVTILLLHEDYPHEVPIFGHSPTDSSSNLDNHDPNHIILCIMGAVRDMTEVEVTSLFTAAKAQQISIVTANLGRTAEFTSKIVMALHAHNVSGRLLSAVEALQRLQHYDDQSSATKLTSARPDQSTWDGHRSSKRQRLSSSSTGTVSLCAVEKRSRDVIVVVTKVPLRPDNITTDLQHRPRLLGLIQLVVYTLWKSRMVSDTAQGMTGPFQSVLYLFFVEGSVARIDQAAIVQEVEENHCPAPSEYQVLSMLIRLLQKPGILNPPQGQGSIDRRLIHVISDIQSRREVTEVSSFKQQDVYLLQPLDIAPLLWTEQQRRHESVAASNTASLSDYAYNEGCHCLNSEATNCKRLKDQMLVLLLGFDDTGDIFKELSKVISGSSKAKKIAKARRKCLSTVVLSESHVSTPAMLVTTLQHWAYHGRLFPALKNMSKQNLDNCDIE